MMVVTKKIKRRDILFIALIVAAILAVLLIPSRPNGGDAAPTVQKAATNEDRIAFLRTVGREVEQAPIEEQEIRIPAADDEILSRYNELQKSQGYDLNDYAGKTVQRYVYRVLNDPSGDVDLYATIFVHNGKIIGGDVASHAPGGTMRALSTT